MNRLQGSIVLVMAYEMTDRMESLSNSTVGSKPRQPPHGRPGVSAQPRAQGQAEKAAPRRRWAGGPRAPGRAGEPFGRGGSGGAPPVTAVLPGDAGALLAESALGVGVQGGAGLGLSEESSIRGAEVRKPGGALVPGLLSGATFRGCRRGAAAAGEGAARQRLVRAARPRGAPGTGWSRAYPRSAGRLLPPLPRGPFPGQRPAPGPGLARSPLALPALFSPVTGSSWRPVKQTGS